MKRLIIFVMVLAISVPALGQLPDIPPEWGNTGTSTGVWNFVTDPHGNRPADCLDPDLGGSGASLRYSSNSSVIGTKLGPSNAFYGDIDDVRVYNRALSEDEIE